MAKNGKKTWTLTQKGSDGFEIAIHKIAEDTIEHRVERLVRTLGTDLRVHERLSTSVIGPACRWVPKGIIRERDFLKCRMRQGILRKFTVIATG
jgi:hypothetical protein